MVAQTFSPVAYHATRLDKAISSLFMADHSGEFIDTLLLLHQHYAETCKGDDAEHIETMRFHVHQLVVFLAKADSASTFIFNNTHN